MIITLDHLKAGCPSTPAGRLALFVEPLNATVEEFGVANVVDFLAQWAHETMGFQKLEESLNYSAARLAQVWKRFAANPDDPAALRRPNALAESLGGKPSAIANNIYGNRYGNGPEISGDGWRYRGRALPHVTFRDNYRDVGAALDLDLVGNPDLLLEVGHACRAGGAFWRKVNGDAIADFEQLTRAINGGVNGLADRYAYRGRFERVLA